MLTGQFIWPVGINRAATFLVGFTGLRVDFGVGDRFMKNFDTTIAPDISTFCLIGSMRQINGHVRRLGPSLCACTILQTMVTKDREDEIWKILEAV